MVRTLLRTWVTRLQLAFGYRVSDLHGPASAEVAASLEHGAADEPPIGAGLPAVEETATWIAEAVDGVSEELPEPEKLQEPEEPEEPQGPEEPELAEQEEMQVPEEPQGTEELQAPVAVEREDPVEEEEIRVASVVAEGAGAGAGPGGEGGIAMDTVNTIAEKVTIKAEVVIGEACKQKFIEECIGLEAIKVVEIHPKLVNLRSHVKEGKVIVQGTLHKQIYYIGLDNLEHHLAEDIDWSELVEIPPVDPNVPVAPGMNEQDDSYVENLIWEYDPVAQQLVQKVILNICIKVTQTEEINVLEDPFGPVIKAKVVIGHGTKQKFLRNEFDLPNAIKVVDIDARLTGIHSHVKTGKVIVQGNLHKQIYYVGTDNIVHHMPEDIPWSEMVEITPLNPLVPAQEGMEEQDHSRVENLIWEFDPCTGKLVQKAIILVDVTVTQTREIPVCLTPYGYFIKTPVVIGHGTKQKFIERPIAIPGIKIVDITAVLRNVTSVVKTGKVIIQGVLHKQIYFVGADDIVHHVFEDIDWSEMVEITPLNPDYPVREGMQEQEHCLVENLLWEFDPATGILIQKVIIDCDVTVTEFQQLHVCDP